MHDLDVSNVYDLVNIVELLLIPGVNVPTTYRLAIDTNETLDKYYFYNRFNENVKLAIFCFV